MVSVIIPVFNAAPYLDECLASVAKQSLSDFECLLVDDGSTDASPAICDRWVAEDRRFHVIHQDNAGVSAARNRGMGAAKGEHVAFIDSDDRVEEDYLEKLFDALTANKADIAVCGLTRDYPDGRAIETVPSPSGFTLDASSTSEFVDLNRKSLLYGPYNKLFRKDLIDRSEACFPVGVSYGEDLVFNYRYLESVKTIACVPFASYHYRILGKGESLSTKSRPNQFETDYQQWKSLKDFHVRKGMWNDCSMRLLYERLWGIVYDGIFSTRTSNRKILSIPEIDELKNYQEVFPCARWIKWCILHRITFAFR